jgi:hypothetical protein
MLPPQKEYIINKHANIRGVDVLLLSFTIEEDKNHLWLMYENKDSIEDSFDNEYMESKTNRKEMIHNIDKYNRRKDFYIKEMEIQGQIIRFDSCSSSIEAMENLCPRYKNFAVIKYETVDNIQ